MSLLHKEDATFLLKTWQHLLEAAVCGTRHTFFKMSGLLALAASLALTGSAALAQDPDEVPVVSPDATLEDVRIAAMMHTRLTIDQIDAAIAEGVQRGEELFRQLDGGGLANIPLPTTAMLAPETDIATEWQCRVKLAACMASANIGHNNRERACDNDFETDRVACAESAVGETEAARARNYQRCLDIAKLDRDACVKESEATQLMETAICRANYNCYPLPC